MYFIWSSKRLIMLYSLPKKTNNLSWSCFPLNHCYLSFATKLHNSLIPFIWSLDWIFFLFLIIVICLYSLKQTSCFHTTLFVPFFSLTVVYSCTKSTLSCICILKIDSLFNYWKFLINLWLYLLCLWSMILCFSIIRHVASTINLN